MSDSRGRKALDARQGIIQFCEDRGLDAPETFCACLAAAAAMAVAMKSTSADFAEDARGAFDATLHDWMAFHERFGSGNA